MSLAALAVAGAVAAAYAVLALLRPRVCLVTLVALDVSNLNGVIASHIGVSPYRPQLALAILVVVVLACRRQLRFAWSPVLLGLLLLTAGCCLSFVNAADPAISEHLLAERIRDLGYFLVVYALLLSTRSAAMVARASVLVLTGLAALSVVHQFVLGNAGDLFGLSRVPLVQEGGALTARHAGTSSDVNFWARLLILFTPLALSLLAVSRTRWSRFVWFGCSVSLLLGIYLTQSRGGFIAVFVALLCWLALAGGWWRRAILAVPVALLIVVPVSGVGSRLLTLAGSLGGSSAGQDLSVLTRKRLQADAFRMFLDQPAFGHGIGSYGTLFPAYDRLSDAYTPVDIVVAAHNFYLEQAADGGIVLLLAWAMLAGTVWFAALRARSITATSGRSSARQATTRFLAVGVIAGLVGWAVASVFLHLSDFRALLLVAAIAAALDVDARQLAVPPLPQGSSARADRPTVRPVLPALAVGAVVGAAGVGGVLAVSPPSYANSATLAVVPSASAADGSNAYQVDVLSRGVIVPTLTQVLDRSVTEADLLGRRAAQRAHVSVSVTQSRLGGSIVVTATGPTPQAVTDVGDRAVALSRATVAGLHASYQLTGAMTGPAPTRTVSGWALVPLGPAAVTGLLVWLWLRRRMAKPRPQRVSRRLREPAPSEPS